MKENYKTFFGDMSLHEIKNLFLENDFSKEEIENIQKGSYDPYKEY